MNTVEVLGIDLGTTNSAIGVWDLEREACQLLLNREGQGLTPSVVAFSEADDALVGTSALDYMSLHPKRVIYSIKRFMGRTLSDESVRHDQQEVVYDVEAVDKEKLVICAGKRRLTPEQVSAKILRQLKQDAEAALGRAIEQAVITVPAYFNEVQRQATKKAGKLTGLKVVRIINEPTAAALAYGLGKGHALVAVYDLGGGTFDISLVEINEGLFEVKATKGDTHLGGDDFDRAIIKWLVSKVAQEHGITLPVDDDAQIRSYLRRKVIEAKITLSDSPEATISLDNLLENKSIVVVLTRSKLEQLVDHLIERTLQICDEALKKAKLPKSAISQVLMVGGQTRMPAIKSKLQRRYGWTINDTINPDEVVARGAAVMGARMCGHLTDQVKLWDVIPLSLGLEVKGGKMETIIEAGKHIPTKSDPYLFTTQRDRQERIRFRIFQGERPKTADNELIGEVIFDLTTPRPKGEHRIECTFRVNAEGILSVRARDADSDAPPVEKTFDRVYHLSPEEVEALKEQSKGEQ